VLGLSSGRRALLVRAVQNTEWRQLLDFVSPSLFDVMPVRDLLAQGRELGANATGRSFGRVRERVQARLDAAEIAVRIEPNRSLEPAPPELRRALGQRALEVYFAQLLAGNETLLDLRFACWTQQAEGSPPVWAPRPLWLRWDPAFLDGVRELYSGFYRGDDGAYQRGVAALGLGDAGLLLRRHFGEGDQRAVRFDSAVFQTTFHQVFVRVAVAGATGFVGRALLPALADRAEVVGLCRREPPAGRDGVTWRRCDLFSLRETEAALAGVEVAYYLVHSMLPSARLTQGRFEDLDLLLADNFGRAAAQAGVRRIVYLGGLLPHDDSALSAHLASRLEVERALGAHGVPVTALRAALVVGAGRLLPRDPGEAGGAAAGHAVPGLDAHALGADRPRRRGGGARPLPRRPRDARPRLRGRRPRGALVSGDDARDRPRPRSPPSAAPGPVPEPGLSKLWVTTVTGAPRALVAPLVESLRHRMVPHERWLQERMGRPGQPFVPALRRALAAEGLLKEPTARSIQRLPLPEGVDASWVAREYLIWLPRFLRPFLEVTLEGPVCKLGLRGRRRPLMQLAYAPARSSPSRALLYVTGGDLVALGGGEKDEPRTPRLEFRITPDGHHVLAAVQDFRPRLPWWLYVWTQARLHAFVMWGFGRHLRRCARVRSLRSGAGP
jgi:hypothetical protein